LGGAPARKHPPAPEGAAALWASARGQAVRSYAAPLYTTSVEPINLLGRGGIPLPSFAQQAAE